MADVQTIGQLSTRHLEPGEPARKATDFSLSLSLSDRAYAFWTRQRCVFAVEDGGW